MTIEKRGESQKFADQVAQITILGKQAMVQGQEILYVTERAVFVWPVASSASKR